MRRTSTSPSSVSPTRRLGAAAATALLAVLLVGCGSDDVSVASDPAAEGAAAELPSWAPQITTDADDSVTGLDFSDIDPLSDELRVANVVTGDGPPVEAGQSITANYFGQLPDADAPFDESFSGSPFTAPIGAGQLIQGWDEGLVGVPVGSRVVMSIPSDLGYGDAGSPPAIPGGATLFFVIDILDAQ